MITFNHVSKEYEDGTKAVAEADFTIEKGEFFVLIGPSGCGKTTTLKMINRLISPTTGEILIDNKNTGNGDIHQLRWNIGYVLQQIALFPHMTVAENISIVPELKGWKRDDTIARIDELLTLVGLEPETYRDRLPEDLSGGQQQRVGVARALAADPDILLMDEPFSALDPISRASLQKDIKALQREIKKTIVFVTHDMDEAKLLGDRIAMMESGRVLQIGTVQQLLANPASESVAQFLAKANSEHNPTIKTVLSSNEESEFVNEILDEGRQELQFIVSESGELEGVFYFGQPIINYQTVAANATIEEAFQQLEERNLPALPVIENGKCIGSVSYQNLAKLAIQPSLHHA
ncbi:ABC transporter ATP-binding protein [Shouchella sp. JSM 1781072]|uniref:ABC transporter ATP-binding protein n=1 Tax=Bacillaceae TaxID=186817 RepID=UPI000C0891CD|nr:ABC transporter ATP-binding protein [Bacillus sp. Marseille-P3800]